ncbi:MAG TPA: helix-turn-helix transcriptional regulator [Mycobacteriales bacterium]|jgi:transcriptional regulator with XRE-family HTH domain|nr:helix-turn-helix transcriptional regulator [Mycobacteriales bacterium]
MTGNPDAPAASAALPAGQGEALFLRALGKRVRLLRRLRELSQEELAQAAGMSRSFVSLIEKGTHGVDVVRLWRLAAVLDVSLLELVDVQA